MQGIFFALALGLAVLNPLAALRPVLAAAAATATTPAATATSALSAKPTQAPPSLPRSNPGEPLVRVAISQSLGLQPRFDHAEVTLVAPGGVSVWSAASDEPVYTSPPGQPVTFWSTQIKGDSSALWLGVTRDAPVGPWAAPGVYVKPVDPADPIGVVNLSRPTAVPYPKYRGALQIIPLPALTSATTPTLSGASPQVPPRPAAQVEPGTVWLVNWIALDEYLYSVVPVEMPANFAAPALQAQAITARTYALYLCRLSQKAAALTGKGSGLTSNGAGVAPEPIPTWADLGDSEGWQSYYGVSAEKPTALAAVQATQSQVITYQGAPIYAFYSSTAGGHTESAGNAWARAGRVGPTAAYLVGVPDDPSWGEFSTEEAFRRFLDDPASQSSSFDANSPYFRWKYEWSRQQLEQQLFRALTRLYASSPTEVNGPPIPKQPNTFGQLVSLNILRRGVSGRAMQLEIVTTAGRWSVWGDLNIRSVLAPAGRSLLPSSAVVVDLLPSPPLGSAGGGSSEPTVPDPPTSVGQTVTTSPSAGRNPRDSANAQGTTDPPGLDGAPQSQNQGSTLPATVVIRGTGYGHGVGLSQWGAEGMARAGYDAAAILAHYYPQTALALIVPEAGDQVDRPTLAYTYKYQPLIQSTPASPGGESVSGCPSPGGQENGE